MKKSRLIIMISVIVVIFGGVLLSDALGLWKTTASRKIIKGNESQISNTHEENDPESDEHGLEVSGTTTVAMALEMGIPEEILIEYLGDISNPDALVKDLIINNGDSFGKIKETLNSYIKSD